MMKCFLSSKSYCRLWLWLGIEEEGKEGERGFLAAAGLEGGVVRFCNLRVCSIASGMEMLPSLLGEIIIV